MRNAKEEASSSAAQAIELISAVKELQRLSSQELNKLLRESENFTVHCQAENGLVIKILLDDVKLSEQLIDLVFYSLIVLSGYKQEVNDSGAMPLLHSVLVACSLHLLTGFISSQWPDLVHVLLAHPKHKTFRERLLRNKELCGRGGVLILARTILKSEISPSFSGFCKVIAATSRLKAKVLSILLHLCEAESVSYLDEVALCPGSLDLAKSVVREVLNLLKSAVGKGYKDSGLPSDRSCPCGLLQLNAMRLADIFSDDSNFRSYITTLFTEVLTAIFSISHGDFLSCWCSSDPPVREEDATLEYDSYASAGWMLDVTSASSHTVSEKNLEFGLVPSNLPQASYAHQRTSLFVKIIANLHCFIPSICEEQERNLFLRKFLDSLLGNVAPGVSHANRTEKASTVCTNLRSLLSHAESLIPTHLNEEDVQLLRVFSNQLHSSLVEENGVKDSKHGGPASLDTFAKLRIDDHQGVQSSAGCSNVLSSRSNKKEGLSVNSAFQSLDNFYVRNKHSGEDEGKTGDSGVGVSREPDKDVQIIETSGSDSSSVKGKNSVDQMENGDSAKPGRRKGSRLVGVQEDDKVESTQGEEKQRKKRKRTIMNEEQIAMIEEALVDEPEMQRNAALVQSWADKLSSYGSEVTSSQLKNWLNNRKARLARAAKDTRAPPEVENNARDKSESPESPAINESYVSSGSRGRPRSASRSATEKTETFSRFEPGQQVALVDSHGDEVAKGAVVQVRGSWFDRSLDEMETYVVDITELKARRWLRLPYPSEATGNSFDEAEAKLGTMRVLWDSNKILNRPNK
ncbi:hypothetical protein CDL15_Pgr022667 [Punica granatum]|uniref:Homeobox domain-containing protein n=1 Tax=Punica granatum TaxID=22663 RepID=A0A218XQU6_PUNGR|nr:hypothetical protein CDL15_Pgr022667 [Punica granatum]